MNRPLPKILMLHMVPVLTLYFAVGAAGLIIPATRDWFTRLVPFTLLLSLLLLFLFHGEISRRAWWASLLIFAAGFLVEVAGVTSGSIFGEYVYGNTLGMKIFQTPLLIGANWLMLVYCTQVIAGRFVEPIYFRSLAAGSMMVVYDFALEPSAIRLGMWNWTGTAVPLQNYLAWFIIAVVLGLVAGRLHLVNMENRVAGPLFFIQLAFFIVLDIWFAMEKVLGS